MKAKTDGTGEADKKATGQRAARTCTACQDAKSTAEMIQYDSPEVRRRASGSRGRFTRGPWPRAGSKPGSGSREMYLEERCTCMRAQGDQLLRGRCEKSSRGSDRFPSFFEHLRRHTFFQVLLDAWLARTLLIRGHRTRGITDASPSP
jgi:hypothetical protein